MQSIWGIDMGGTKIEGVVLEPGKTGFRELARQRIPTEKEKGYDHIIQRVGGLIDQLKAQTGLQPKKIGMGTPGTLDPITQLHKNANTTALNGQPFKKDLEERLGLSFTLANDANCFAIAEAKMGAAVEGAPGAKLVFGVIMGTGVGGGIVFDGKVWNGRQGIGGEWGHSFLDESGGVCYCGNLGCVETVIAGPALERYYRELSGQTLSLQEIVNRYGKQQDEIADKTIKRLIHYFGKGMANIINTLDPDAIILGGGLGNISLLYTEGLEAIMPFLFNPRLDTIFLRPKLGDSAGVYGAAMLVAD
ncbi:MAG: sugar kinase [Saprospiraceae bacterium]|nr:MAG: sugar kinase [Saprospiraceae bacterium]